ncbi:carbon-nitrogen hydrolase family protein [Novosphingobium terrae]|uniref:carbon-nitrogen hydrolase family protein n=1 Tax=Novosphingobium terrae TaxID=2726189 RepID=UPI00198237E9|nr:carbon-nitrogen hydrolase family protein [Novosphingobium terrae]
MSAYTIALAQYPIDQFPDWAAYEAKLTRWVEQAAAGGAALAVFPEYGAMELASLDAATQSDLHGSLATVAGLMERADALHADLAARHGLHILAASGPVLVEGHYLNRARLFTPEGKVGHQDKLMMTRFEAEEWGVFPASAVNAPLHLFETALGRIAIAICYDSEFPLIARAAVEAGAQLLLVPSCTDTPQGYWRVRIGSQARALEGQMYVAQSPTVGLAPWSPALDVNHGAAGLYGPPDGPKGGDWRFPPDGVIAIGSMDASQWVFAQVDLARVEALRANGGVLPARDWVKQPGAVALPKVEVVDLR